MTLRWLVIMAIALVTTAVMSAHSVPSHSQAEIMLVWWVISVITLTWTVWSMVRSLKFDIIACIITHFCLLKPKDLLCSVIIVTLCIQIHKVVKFYFFVKWVLLWSSNSCQPVCIKELSWFEKSLVISVWKSSYKTGKKPRPNRTLTDQDRKFPGPLKTVNPVRSSVYCYFKISKTDENQS